MADKPITFSFGENWKDYLETISERAVEEAKRDIEGWLGKDNISGKDVVDVGSGSGIHSLAFCLLGAKKVFSFDVDKSSVEATKLLREKMGGHPNWSVEHGSILDENFLESIGRFDVVYAWGCLHHTGAMWKSLENCFNITKSSGRMMFSLYAKGPCYSADLALKQKYNAASGPGKRWMVDKWIFRLMLRRLNHFRNPFAWNESRARGMNVYNDLVDWLGGLPYEVASEDEVVGFGKKHGFTLDRIKVEGERMCNIYVLSAPEKKDG